MSKLCSNASWIKQAWRCDPATVDDIGKSMKFASRANYSFSDTGPGGSPTLNPPPQSSINTDLRVGLASTTDLKIGRKYYETAESNAQIIYLRGGVTAYNSLATFYVSVYDPAAGQLANTGRVAGNLLTGFLATAITAVIGITTNLWPLLVIRFIVYVAQRATMKPRTKYCYHSPTMINTWRRANLIAMQFAVNDEFIPTIFEKEAERMFGDALKTSVDDRKHLGLYFPDMFTSDGALDLFTVATRWHRNNMARMKLLDTKGDTISSILGWVAAPGVMAAKNLYNAARGILSEKHSPAGSSLMDYQKRWEDMPANKPVNVRASTNTLEDAGGGPTAVRGTPGAEDVLKLPSPKEDGEEKTKSWWTQMTTFAMLELDDGGAFLAFSVSDTGPSTMSTSNQTADSEVKAKFDSIVESSRNTVYNVAAGNFGDGPIAGLLETILGGGRAVISQVANNFGLSVFGALAGAAQVDFPQRYTGSTASMPTMNYTIELNATYNNAYCRLVQLWLPLAALIAVAFPQQTGAQSYAGPPVLELFDRGHAQTRYGMAESMTISVGEGNLSHNSEWKPSSIKVSLNIRDLSPIIYAPISQGFSFDPTATVFDEDTNFSDYCACISGVELHKQIYYMQKLKRNLTRKLAKTRLALTPAHFGAMLGNFGPARIFDLLLPGSQLR